jgi:uroporphyrinogen decarboxylase
MWFHFNPELSVRDAADAHFRFVRETDMDVIKIMYDNSYTLDRTIKDPSDWFHIKPEGKKSPFYQKQRAILLSLLEKGAGEYPVWMTMFGPFKFGVMAAGDELVMAHSRENPGAVKSGVAAIADTLVEWAEGFLDDGADAIFYSAQFGEVGRFSREEWNDLVVPFDLAVLAAAENRLDKYNVLHLCGEKEYGFRVHIDRFGSYPGAMVNWAIHQNGYELERGRDLFARPVMGGLDNHGVMAHGTEGEVKSAVRELIQVYGNQPFMIGANCSIESTEHIWRIKAAVDEAKS